jgi:hypothetical protein
LTIAWRRDGIPPAIWHESTVKEVEAAQIFDVETAGEIVLQFGRCKLVKAKCNMSAVAEVDLASVSDVISIGGHSRPTRQSLSECFQPDAPSL